ncbi:MAG: cupin domain-containing protein [Lentisphaerae bacterium]|nr:cupin domain-containing protein [Lentisphaerota bacterium]
MIHSISDYKSEVREAMRGGDKSVKITHYFDEANELGSPTRLCARLDLEPGASIGFHTHENEEEIFIVLAGKALVDDNGVEKTVCAGDSILTGNGAGHAVKNIGDETLSMVAVIVPFAK